MKPSCPELLASRRQQRRKLLAAALAAPLPLLLTGPARAATPARRIEAFDAQTWAALQATLTQPAAVVFSTTDCTHCPAVIRQLALDLARRSPRATLVAVVMDQAPGDDDPALLANPHYRPAQRLFAFDGQGPLIRHAVDPGWRGMTPYTRLLTPGAAPRAITGPVSAADLDAWLPRPRR